MTYSMAALRSNTLSSPRDESAVDVLIRKHMPLVRRLAWHVHGRVSSAADVEELMQAGMVALVEAARAFEDRGFEFASYASVRIRGAMIDHLRRGSSQSRGASATRRAIERARRAVESRRSGTATPQDIAAELDVTVEAYFRMESDARAGAQESLDDVYSEADVAFRDGAPLQDEIHDKETAFAQLRDAIAALDARSQLVLQLYFFEELNLEEIGRVMNVGAARVCQLKRAALEALRRTSTLAVLALGGA
jgi:RNA polymerase sigma factor FliA